MSSGPRFSSGSRLELKGLVMAERVSLRFICFGFHDGWTEELFFYTALLLLCAWLGPRGLKDYESGQGLCTGSSMVDPISGIGSDLKPDFWLAQYHISHLMVNGWRSKFDLTTCLPPSSNHCNDHCHIRIAQISDALILLTAYRLPFYLLLLLIIFDDTLTNSWHPTWGKRSRTLSYLILSMISRTSAVNHKKIGF